MEITKNRASKITAADEDFETEDFETEDFEDPDIEDSLDDMADTIDDIQDDIDDIEEDDVSIEVENNITDHYIAECEKCKGIFISAVVESDQELTSISGVCPLCEAEGEQLLKWVIKDA